LFLIIFFFKKKMVDVLYGIFACLKVRVKHEFFL
jgi:hypothetical protein